MWMASDVARGLALSLTLLSLELKSSCSNVGMFTTAHCRVVKIPREDVGVVVCGGRFRGCDNDLRCSLLKRDSRAPHWPCGSKRHAPPTSLP